MSRSAWRRTAIGAGRALSRLASDADLRIAKSRLEPVGARHTELSAVFSVDDALGAPSERLLDLAARVPLLARAISLPLLRDRGAPGWVECWPGEHYRLLAALVAELRPRTVIDVGTFTGLSALAMAPGLGPSSRLVTVDLHAWSDVRGTHLLAEDFVRWPLVQILGDLGDPATAARNAALLRDADFIMIDAAKDGIFESRLLENFEAIGLKEGAILMFDDIRIWSMLPIWRAIRRPKLDLTSFGHWTGTGLVEWR